MGVIENAKEIASLVRDLGNMDLYRKIIDLESEIVELTTDNMDLQKEVGKLQEKLALKGKMTFRKPFYYMENDETPYCPKCWEADRKTIHLLGPTKVIAGPRYDCPECKQHFIWPPAPVKPYSPPRKKPQHI